MNTFNEKLLSLTDTELNYVLSDAFLVEGGRGSLMRYNSSHVEWHGYDTNGEYKITITFHNIDGYHINWPNIKEFDSSNLNALKKTYSDFMAEYYPPSTLSELGYDVSK